MTRAGVPDQARREEALREARREESRLRMEEGFGLWIARALR